MSSLPTWAKWSIAVAVMLLSPIFGVLTAIGVETVIGLLVEAGAPAVLAFVAAGAVGWPLLRKRLRHQGAPQLRRERVRRSSAKEYRPSES